MTSPSPLVFRPIPTTSPLSQFLNKHNTGHNTFISHVDKFPATQKAKVFLTPLFLNFCLGCLLAYRVFKFKDHYYPLILWILGKDGPGINVLWLFIDGFLDIFLFRYLWPILRNFCVGNLWFRIHVGFQPEEIVFRKPTGWRRLSLDNLPQDQFDYQFNRAMTSASDPHFVNSHTGYDTRFDFWVLDYKTAIHAHSMHSRKQIKIEEWDLRVWQFKEGQWWVWDVWRIRDMEMNADTNMRKIESRLTELGKAHIMPQWKKILQDAAATAVASRSTDGDDSSDDEDPSSLPPEVHSRVVQLFSREGVDFERLCEETLS